METWIDIIDREYLTDYIPAGGGAVKFLVGGLELLAEASAKVDLLAERHEYIRVDLHAAQTRMHRIDHIFFEIARQIDWDGLAASFVAEGFRAAGWKVQQPVSQGFDLADIAWENGVEVPEVRVVLRSWLQGLYDDFHMGQDFRLALLQLCRAQIKGLEHSAVPVQQWLRGELPRISELKAAKIFQKINRHNARLAFESLTYWLHRNGRQGLLITLDISRCFENPRKLERKDGFYYTTGSLTEVYELLRQLIDGSSELRGTFITVFTTPEFLSDEKRGVDRYQALKMRIFDDVRPAGLQNLLAPLVRLTEGIC